jgi:DNA transformation protein and related proteins
MTLEKNIGPKTAAWLEAIGVRDRADLERLGVEEVYERLKLAGFPITLVGLYALEGAVTGTHWQRIPLGRREALKRFVAQTRASRA